MKEERGQRPIQFRLVAKREELTTEEGRHLTGSGYVICDATSGQPLGDDDFFFRIGGGIVCDLADASTHLDELQGDAFAAGQTLALARSGDAIEVRDAAGAVTVGTLPADIAESLAFSEIQSYGAAFCLWEWRAEAGRRFALRLLLAPGWKAEHLAPGSA